VATAVPTPRRRSCATGAPVADPVLHADVGPHGEEECDPDQSEVLPQGERGFPTRSAAMTRIGQCNK